MKKRNKLFKAMAVFLAVLLLASLFFTVIGVLVTNGRADDSISDLEAKAKDLAGEQQSLAEEKQKIEDRKNELQGTIDSLQNEIGGVMKKKALIDENIQLTQQELDNLEQQVELLNDAIDVKREEYEQALVNEQEQMELFKKRLREMEEAGNISYYEILFDASSFSDLLGRLDMISEILRRDEATIDCMEQARLEVVLAQQELYDSKEECELKQAELAETQVLLEQERLDADDMMQKLEEDQAIYTAAYEENAELEAKIEKELQATMAEAAAIEQRIKRIQQANSAGSSDAGSSGYTVAEANGTYIWPSAASVYVTSKFGERFHPILKYTTMHYGIDIGASYGTDIYASDGGVVVTSKYSESYGNYVMIYHGDDRYTLYAHMSSRLVDVDDVVSQGDVIGLVGSTGYSTGAHIHFEIYEGGTRVDPLNYFSNYILYNC